MKSTTYLFSKLLILTTLFNFAFAADSFAGSSDKETLTIVGNLTFKFFGDGDDDYEFIGKVENFDAKCGPSVKDQARGPEMLIKGTATIWDPMSELRYKVKACRNRHKIVLDVKNSIYCGGNLVAKIKKFTCSPN